MDDDTAVLVLAALGVAVGVGVVVLGLNSAKGPVQPSPTPPPGGGASTCGTGYCPAGYSCTNNLCYPNQAGSPPGGGPPPGNLPLAITQVHFDSFLAPVNPLNAETPWRFNVGDNCDLLISFTYSGGGMVNFGVNLQTSADQVVFCQLQLDQSFNLPASATPTSYQLATNGLTWPANNCQGAGPTWDAVPFVQPLGQGGGPSTGPTEAAICASIGAFGWQLRAKGGYPDAEENYESYDQGPVTAAGRVHGQRRLR